MLWFDEGQHLIKVAGASGLLDQLDVMKSLANRSHIPTMLFGTYEMNVLLGLSPQLDRRIFHIHIPRYQATETADVAAFQQVLSELERGIRMVTGLNVVRSDSPGWIGLVCASEDMALWLLRAIVVENISVRREGETLYFPASPRFSLEREIKNVITVIAKTYHYWQEHVKG